MVEISENAYGVNSLYLPLLLDPIARSVLELLVTGEQTLIKLKEIPGHEVELLSCLSKLETAGMVARTDERNPQLTITYALNGDVFRRYADALREEAADYDGLASKL